MRFGIFDWIDENRPLELADIYEQRLQMLEYADRAGFYCYHLAEHHGTRLGMAPSPALFLAAAAQRTHRIRLGSLVTLLPLYSPLRLVEEIAMLDHLTHGRLELGVGRGTSPAELALFNVDSGESRAMFQEALGVILAGLSTGTISHEGHYYQFKDVALPLRPHQHPYPPLWYPTSNAESIPWIAAQGFNLLLSATTPSLTQSGVLLHQYRELFDSHAGDSGRLNHHVDAPRFGFSRHVFVADTDAEAREQARTAWEEFNLNYAHRPGPGGSERYARRPGFDAALEQSYILVGSPSTVCARLQEWVDVVGGNYFVGVFAFGNLSTTQVLRSIQLFAEGVIPNITVAEVRAGRL